MCLPPACFETGFGFVSGFEEGRSRNFSQKKIQKISKCSRIPTTLIRAFNSCAAELSSEYRVGEVSSKM